MTTLDLPIADIRKALCKNIHTLSIEKRQEILNYALQQLSGKKLIACSDGTCLSLNSSIPDDVIIGMHDMLQSRMVFFDALDFKNN